MQKISYLQPDSDSNQDIQNPFEEFIKRKCHKKPEKDDNHRRRKKNEQKLSDNSIISKDDYHVNKIKGKRIRHGVVQYLVSWVGYDGEDTWEGLSNLRHITDDINQFEAKIRSQQLKKISNRLKIHNSYEFDLSQKGNQLIKIGQQQAKQTINYIYVDNFQQEKEDSGQSYVSSYINQLISNSQKNHPILQQPIKIQNSLDNHNICNSTIISSESSRQSYRKQKNQDSSHSSRKAESIFQKVMKKYTESKQTQQRTINCAQNQVQASFPNKKSQTKQPSCSIKVLRPCSDIRIYRSQPNP